MSRKQYKPFTSSHEKKLSKKERRAQNPVTQNVAPQEEIVPTEQDTVQIKNLALYATIGILALLGLMYWLFINSL